jgi:hypothetical protein
MPQLLNIGSEKFAAKYDRSEMPEFQSQLRDTSGPYSLFPPILCPVGDIRKKMIFWNPILPQVRTN